MQGDLYRMTPATDAQPVQYDRQCVIAQIAALRAGWKELKPTQRGWCVRRILEANPEMTKSALAKELGVSQPVVGYHQRFTYLSKEDQALLDEGKLKDSLAKAMSAYVSAMEASMKPAQNAIQELMDGSEDLECPEEVAGVVTDTIVVNPDQLAKTQVLPDYIASRVMNPMVPFIPASSVVQAQPNEFQAQSPFQEICPLSIPEPEPVHPMGSLDAAVASYREWIGWEGEPKPCGPRPQGQWVKILVTNDWHVPFQDDESVRIMVERDGDADRVVLAGDFNDMFNWSHFPKFSRTHTPAQEFFESARMLTYLNETFPRTDVFEGNHDDRFMKWLVKDRGVPAEMLEYFNLLAPGFMRPLSIMCKELTNIHLVQPIEYEHAKFAFLHQFGDFVVGHAETYSKIPNRATTNFAHWLKSFAEPLGLVKDFRCVGQAHTHQAGMVFGDYALWNFELGCMCQLEEYVGSPRIITPRPWVKGYTVVIQDAETGRTDINQTRFVHTGKF